MEQKSRAEMEQVATLYPAMPGHAFSRRARLERWAQLLRQRGGSLEMLHEMEFSPRRVRRSLRADNSAITIALQDPVLRSHGLRGDTLGDAAAFFSLSEDEAHFILCNCHYAGRSIASVDAVAQRICQVAAHPRWARLQIGVIGAPFVIAAAMVGISVL